MQYFPLFIFRSSLSHRFLTCPPINQNQFWILIRPPSLWPWQANIFIYIDSNPFVNCTNESICQKQTRENHAGLLSSRFDNLSIFSVPPAHRKQAAKAVCSLLFFWALPMPVEVFNDIVRRLFTPPFSTEKFSPMQHSCAQGNWPIHFLLNSLWLVLASWWSTQLKTQHSVLITWHVQSIALISWPARSKPNYRLQHGPPSSITTIMFLLRLGRDIAPWGMDQCRSDGMAQCGAAAHYNMGRLSNHPWHTWC